MTVRWKELTSASGLPVTVAEAKTALRVVDTQSVATKANRSVGSGNSQLLVTAKIAGAIGNQYATRVVVSGNNTALSVTFASNVLTINTATDGSGNSTSTVNDVIAAIYANADASAIFDASDGSGNGTGVLLAAAQANLTAGVDSGDEDAYINFLILAAAEVLESLTGRVFMSRTFRAFYDDWPCDGVTMELPISPVTAVTKVEYLDTSEQYVEFTSKMTLDAEDDLLPARLVLKESEVFPVLAEQMPNRVRVDFTAGFATIPNKIKQCILFLVAHWYQSREPVVNGTAVLSNKVPFTFETVLNSFRLLTV